MCNYTIEQKEKYDEIRKSVKDMNFFYKREKEYDYHKLSVTEKSVKKYLEERAEFTALSEENQERAIDFYTESVVFPNCDINDLDIDYNISLGAAIWILDELRENNTLADALPILNSVRSLMVEKDLSFYLQDLIHDEDLIFSMQLIICFRNEDSIFDDNIYTIADMYSARKEVNPNGLTRKQFDAIIALLDENRIKKAIERFENDVKREAKRIIRSTFPKFEKYLRLCRRRDRLVNMAEEKKEKVTKMMPGTQNGPVRDNPISNFDFAPRSFPSVIDNGRSNTIISEIEEIYNELDQTRDKAKDIIFKMNHVLTSDFALHQMDYEKMGEIVGEDQRDNFYYIDSTNPYETLFSVLYLFDTGSEVPWQTLWVNRLCSVAAESLPWSLCLEEAINIDDITPDPMVKRDTLDWNAKGFIYSLDFEGSKTKKRATLSQLLYEKTHVLPPRFIPEKETLDLINRLDVSAPQEIANAFSYMAEYSKRLNGLFPNSNDEKSADDHLKRELDQLRQENKKLEQQVKRQNQENVNLSRDLRAMEKELQKEKELRLGEENSREADMLELAALREFILNQNKENENGRGEEVNVSTGPVELKGKILIVGGHDSWLTAFKPQIVGNISYIDRNSSSFSHELVRNADAIFIKTNAIGHSLYKPLITTARRYNRSVYYLNSASAAKDVEEIARICR